MGSADLTVLPVDQDATAASSSTEVAGGGSHYSSLRQQFHLVQNEQQSLDVHANHALAKAVESELSYYLSVAATTDSQQAIKFGLSNSDKFPKLCMFAVNLLSVPATSTTVARLFSQSSLVRAGKWFHLKPATCCMFLCSRLFHSNVYESV